ncbi:hypothetical protein F8388_018082, partial [Cannabis sativa]
SKADEEKKNCSRGLVEEARDWRVKLREEGECILVVMADRDQKSRWRTVIDEVEEKLRLGFFMVLKRNLIEAEDEKINLLLSEVKGKDLTKLIASGREKLGLVPSGGGVVAFSAPAGGANASPAAVAESKKEEKFEEKEESNKDDMIFSLFD